MDRRIFSPHPNKGSVYDVGFFNEDMIISFYGDNTYHVFNNTQSSNIIDSTYIYPNELIYYSYDQYKKFFVDKLIENTNTNVKDISYHNLSCLEENVTFFTDKLRDLLDNFKDAPTLTKTYNVLYELDHDGEISYIVCIKYSHIPMMFHLDIKTFTKWKLMNG